jgi:hypothetical protein
MKSLRYTRVPMRTPGVFAAAMLAAGCVALIGYARTADASFAPAGDIALIETYTIHATRGELFLGPYSRFGWNHPGPLYFYTLAPFYVLTGFRSAGLSAGALAINLAALALLVWVSVSMGRGLLAICVAAAAVWFTWQTSGMLASQWNPHVLVLPTMATIVASAAVAAGRVRLLPVVAALATFIVQTHLGFGPTVLAVGVAGAAIAAARAQRSGDPSRPEILRVLIATVCVLLVLWLPPLIEEVRSADGNLTRLWTFFTGEGRPGQRFQRAFRMWSDMMSAFVRRDVRVGWGNRLPADGGPWRQAWALAQTAALAAIVVRAAMTKDTFRGALAGMLLIASGVGLWSLLRIEDAIYDHLVFWLSGIGALAAGVIAATVLRLVLREAAIPRRLPAAVCITLWVIAAAVGFQQLRVVVSRSFRPGIEPLAARRLGDALIDQFERKDLGRPLVRIDQPVWTVAAGVLLQLEKRQIPYGVEEGWWFMFGAATRPSGQETSTLVFAGPGMRAQLTAAGDHEILAERDRVSILFNPDRP